jgi:8-oxo-dGTP diphosphatase
MPVRTAPLQFGEPEPGVGYQDRPAAFGVLERDGRIALVRVTKPGMAPWLDLPGGALDSGESDEQAMVREFGEETGLLVRPGRLIGRADQYFRRDNGDPVNNRSAIFHAIFDREAPSLKCEDDHELVWLEPGEAMARVRHDSHAWALLAAARRPA